MARQPGFLKRGEPVRLQAFLARSGISSRRGAEEMITHGRIAVNGKTVTAMGMTVVPGVDRVAVDGEEVKVAPTTWLALHKPTGYVTTRSDPFDRRTVYDLLPEKYHGLFHVGRLDRDSEGLLLLTNDGELANRFLHPSFGITKEYDVVAKGKPTDAALRKLVEGVELEDGMAQAESAKLLGPAGNGLSRLKLVLREGKKREVRRMLAALGHEVTRLVRRRFGPIELGELPKGKYRVVQPDELSHVRTPPSRTRAADTHGAYENASNKPRSKAAAGRAKTEAPRLRETAAVGERRPRFKSAGEEPRTRAQSAADEPRARTKAVGDESRTRARSSGDEPRTSARTGERAGSRVGGDATPKRAGGARGGTKLRSGARFDAPEIGKKRRPGQEQRGRPADPNPRPPGPRKEARSLNEWDDDAPPPRTAERTSRSRPDREYEDRPAARAGSARGDRAERGGRAGGTRSGAERGGRGGGARGGFDRGDRAGGSRGGAGERGDRAGGARGGFDREDRAPSRGGTGERGGRAGGARGGFDREDRAGGSRGGTGERGGRGGGARGGFDREDRAPARGGTGERGGRGGGARGGFDREDRAPARGGAGVRGGGARGAGGERGSRSGGTRGGSFERDDRPGPPRGRFGGEERDGGARGVRPGATRGPSPADDDRDELDDWGTAPRRPRTGGAGGPRGGARGGRPGAGRGGGARGGGSRAGGSRGGPRPDADGGSDAPRGGGARGGGGRPGAGGRGGGGRPGGRPGGARGGGARGGRPGGGRRG